MRREEERVPDVEEVSEGELGDGGRAEAEDGTSGEPQQGGKRARIRILHGTPKIGELTKMQNNDSD